MQISLLLFLLLLLFYYCFSIIKGLVGNFP